MRQHGSTIKDLGLASSPPQHPPLEKLAFQKPLIDWYRLLR